MIYFLLNEDERLIEIGVTASMNTRLDRLRGGSVGPLRLLAVVDGGSAQATAIRARFAHLQALGDWYRIDARLVEYIEREGRPWVGSTPIGTPEYRDRLADLATRSNIPSATLAELALTEWAGRNGLSDDPALEGEAADIPPSAPPIAIGGSGASPGALAAARLPESAVWTIELGRRP